MRRFVCAAMVLLWAAAARAQSAPLTLRQAVAEALAASPALRSPDDSRTLAGIRERQAAGRFGLKLTPSVQSAADPNGQGTRWIGIAATKRLASGTTLQFNA